MSFEFKVSGLDQVKKQLLTLSPKIAERVERAALRQGANYMAKAVRAAAPVKTGRLRRAVKVKNSKIHRLQKNGQVGVYLTVSAGKNRKDQKGAYYARWVENGYNTGQSFNGENAIKFGVINKLKVYKDLGKAYRKTGKIKTAKQLRYHKRGGGKDIAGRFFVKNTFSATKNQAAELIIQASKIIADRVAKSL